MKVQLGPMVDRYYVFEMFLGSSARRTHCVRRRPRSWSAVHTLLVREDLFMSNYFPGSSHAGKVGRCNHIGKFKWKKMKYQALILTAYAFPERVKSFFVFEHLCIGGQKTQS